MKGNFQIITIIVFIFLAVFGVLVFSGAIPLGGGNTPGAQGTVVLWGTVSSATMSQIIEDFNNTNPSIVVRYVEMSPDTFDEDLLEAIASGTGPDIFFMPDDLTYQYANKIVTIPYQSYPVSAFKNNFVGAGEVFLNSNGILALPIMVDPLVMYYNRSMLDADGIVSPPAYWDEFVNQVQTLTKKDDSNKILKSGAALGNFTNVAHAKEILTTMFMQTGNPIVAEQGGAYTSVLNSLTQNYNLASVLSFYTDFANPSQPIYSWNRSLPPSTDVFSREDLAFYFGYASELQSLVNRNPNQNFFVAPVPQVRSANMKVTGARVTGLAISSFSRNFAASLNAAGLMASGEFANKLREALGVAPARRDLLQQVPTDAYASTFYNSALYARSWIDPSSEDTDNIFRQMIDNVLSNSLRPSEALADASSKLELLLLRR